MSREACRADDVFPVNGHSMESDYPDGSMVFVERVEIDDLSYGDVMINNTFRPHVWFENSGDVFEDNLVMRPYLPIGMPPR